ncbi:LacI family DNA-binding transcriptional regulator [Geochorda subterranea]|uniref:LacI family DNA-binding transcriptional regulator n=1 Tax=Geochorda subterranea TaxID=3109564 RepID=A0ABZ1BTK0_9FIRM|nr:LacI family DNA-binding transcriptional regulator [Limnochorda sp. LNt]WRP15903.1 LacI family DNA-binding transcriptional regulator [Limnochorda sp. LNt]
MGPTIRDVAARARVSKATVSYVLNGRPGVSARTRQRVLEVMEELGYRPNTVARSLASRKTQTLGLVIPDISDMFYAHIIRGVESAANERDYILNLCTTRSDPRREREVVDSLMSGRVDGVILMTYSLDHAYLEKLRATGRPFVLLDDPDAGPSLHAVSVDNSEAGFKAAEYLISLGHRKIAFIHGSPRSRDTWYRFSGFRRALQASGVALREEYVRVGDFTRDGGFKAASELMSLPDPPTAILAANDQMAIGALEAITRSGRRVPEDVSLMGVDDIEAASMIRPPLTTIRQPTYEMGRQAVDLLVRLIGGEELEPRHILLPVTLVVRESCRSAT